VAVSAKTQNKENKMGLFNNTYSYTLSASGPKDNFNVLGWWTPDCPYELYDTSGLCELFYSLATSIFREAGVSYIDLSLTNVEEIDSNNMEITQYYAPIMVKRNMDGMFKVQVVVAEKGMINKTLTFKLEVSGVDISKKSPNTQGLFDAGFANLKSFLTPYGFS